jgi:hypothetical protein
MSLSPFRKRAKAAAIGVATACVLSGCRFRMPPPYISEPHWHRYVYNETVRFGLGGDSHRFRLLGWSHTEPYFTWTEGIGASLIFFVNRTSREVTLEMKLKPLLHEPDLPEQPVSVSINGRKIATWDVTEEKVYSVIVPHDFIAARPDSDPTRPNLRDSIVLVVDLLIPKAQFPALLGTGPDWRRLGVACSALVMREGAEYHGPTAKLNVRHKGEGAPYALGTVVLMGAAENGARYKRTGWNVAEAGHTWSGRVPAVMKFKLPPTKRGLVLTVTANGNTVPPRLLAQTTVVRANGTQVAEWKVDVLGEYTAEIPAGIVGPDGRLTLEFETKDAMSPQELGLSSDSRPLGLACYALLIAEADD